MRFWIKRILFNAYHNSYDIIWGFRFNNYGGSDLIIMGVQI